MVHMRVVVARFWIRGLGAICRPIASELHVEVWQIVDLKFQKHYSATLERSRSRFVARVYARSQPHERTRTRFVIYNKTNM